MITAVEIENFKGIRERTRIEIKPITLLFGPNSAGKSTLLHALQLAREIFTRRNVDVDVTDGGAEFIDLGGFRNYVHGRDATKAVVLRFDLDLSSTNFLTEFPIPEYHIPIPGREANELLDVSTIGDEVQNGWVEIEICWNRSTSSAYVRHYTIGLNGEPFARICEEPSICDLNIYHPLVRWGSAEYDSIGVLDYLNPEARPFVAQRYFAGQPVEETSRYFEPPEFIFVQTPLARGTNGWLLREVTVEDSGVPPDNVPLSCIYAAREDGSAIHLWGVVGHTGFWSDDEIADKVRQHSAHLADCQKAIERGDGFYRNNQTNGYWASLDNTLSLDNQVMSHPPSALPDFERDLEIDGCESLSASAESVGRTAGVSLKNAEEMRKELDREREAILENRGRERKAVFQKLLSRLLLGPGRALRNALNELRYVGPVRDAVPRHFSPPRFPDPRRWAGGLAAWEELARDRNELPAEVDKWLGEEDRLNTGFGVRVERYRELPVEHQLNALLERGGLIDEADPDTIKAMLRDLPTKHRPLLVTRLTQQTMQPADVGQGITQAVPVIVAALHPFGDSNKPRAGLVAIEQPELHLNPRQQAALGDVFVAAALQSPKNRFILETHSEHLILRLQRRIREATNRRNEATPGRDKRSRKNEPPPPERVPSNDPLTQDVRDTDIGVVYVSSSEGRTLFGDMPLDLTGDFVMPWPDDFFEIDFHERFGQ